MVCAQKKAELHMKTKLNCCCAKFNCSARDIVIQHQLKSFCIFLLQEYRRASQEFANEKSKFKEENERSARLVAKEQKKNKEIYHKLAGIQGTNEVLTQDLEGVIGK